MTNPGLMRTVEKSWELEYNTGVVVRSRDNDPGFQLGPPCGRVLNMKNAAQQRGIFSLLKKAIKEVGFE